MNNYLKFLLILLACILLSSCSYMPPIDNPHKIHFPHEHKDTGTEFPNELRG